MSIKRILVPVKQTVDYAVKVRVKADRSGVELKDVKMSMNPFDEIALEEAIRLKEKKLAEEIVCVTLGPKSNVEMCRKGMALGADRSIHVETDEILQPLAVAKLLQKIVEKETPDLVILGKQAIDDDSCQTGQLLGGLLNWPQGMFAAAVDLQSEPGRVIITRETDTGSETINTSIPAVISADLRLNTPRFAKLQNIMKARKMPVEVLTPEALGIDVKPRLQVLSVEEPSVRKSGVIVKSVDELVEKLKADGLL